MRHPCKFQRVSRLGSVTARHSSSECQPNFAALNIGRHLYSAGRPSRWALAHISSSNLHSSRSCDLIGTPGGRYRHQPRAECDIFCDKQPVVGLPQSGGGRGFDLRVFCACWSVGCRVGRMFTVARVYRIALSALCMLCKYRTSHKYS